MNEQLYDKYYQLVAQKKELESAIEATQEELYSLHLERFNQKDTGTIKVEDAGYLLTVVKKEATKVDQALAAKISIGFKVNYKLDKKRYGTLTQEDKLKVDKCLTITPGRPTFKLEKVEA